MAIPSKQRKCRHCRQMFQPARCGQNTCSYECSVAVAEIVAAKSKARREKAERIAEAASVRILKLKLKTRSQWMKEAQKAWNFYVRMRDYGKPCISCGAMPENKFGGTMDCSHYRSVGSAPHLRFNLHNAAAGCVKCNRYLGGNSVALRDGLINRIGLEKVEAIESNNDQKKFDIEYLKRLKKIFNKKAKKLQKRLY